MPLAGLRLWAFFHETNLQKPASRSNPTTSGAILAAVTAALALGCGVAHAQSVGDEPLRGTFALPQPIQTPDPSILTAEPDADGVPPARKSTRRARPQRPRPPGSTRTPTAPDLPQLAPYPTAPAPRRVAAPGVEPMAGELGPYPAADRPDPPVSQAAIPGPPQVRRKPEDLDPFAPTGIRRGAFLLRPSIEQAGGYDSNPNRASGPHSGSLSSRTEAALTAQSDWSRHQLDVDLRGSYTAFTSLPDANQPEGAARATLRLDMDRLTTMDLEARANLTTLRPGSPETGGATGRSNVATLGASAGVTRKAGRLALSVKALADHTQYEDGRLAGGLVLPLSLDNYATYGVTSRASYLMGSALNPFVETTLDLRRHDSALDSAGYRRDSRGLTARVGNAFDVTRTLTGEIGVGYTRRSYEDSRFQPVGGGAFSGSLVWLASALTKVTLRGSTEIGETNLAGASGVLTKKADLEINHALRRYLTLSALASFSRADYQGVSLTQDTWTAGLRAEYKLNRNMAIRGSYTHEMLRSSAVGANYSADAFLLGLKLQR